MAKKPMPKIGVDMFHYFPVVDDGKQTTYGEAKALPGSVNIGFSVDSSSAKFFADNGPYATGVDTGDMKLSLECADVPPAVLSEWMGAEYNGGLFEFEQVEEKAFGVAYRIKKAGGGYRYIRLYSGQFTMPDQNGETKAGSTNFQTSTVEFSAIKRTSDGKVYAMLDDDDESLPADITPQKIQEEWFKDLNWKPDVSTDEPTGE